MLAHKKIGTKKKLLDCPIFKSTFSTASFLFIVLSPLIRLVVSASLMIAVYWTVRRSAPLRVDHHFRGLSWFPPLPIALAMAQTTHRITMGIITTVLFAAGILDGFFVPFCVVLMAHAAIGLETLADEWRFAKTMGMRITKLKPVGGFCAETATVVGILGTALAGIPVSTTQTIAGGIMGVGGVQRLSAVRWEVARGKAWAWIRTIPVSGAFAALCFWVLLKICAAA
jgi:PiT family inorganic phosphate transporter